MEDWIWNLCADIALRPVRDKPICYGSYLIVQYKLLSKSHLSFAEGEPKRKASSMTDALELMLQEVQGITSSAAAGITAIYPTFAELMLAFERAERRGGIEKAENMLADCEVGLRQHGCKA
jgi:crossover junction endonuclease EME1